MTDIIDEGWLWLYSGTTYLKLFVERVKGNWSNDPRISHYAGPSHLGYTLSKRWLNFLCMGVWGTSHTNISNIIDYLFTWQDAGTFTAKFIRDTSNNGIEFDGDNETYTVMIAKDGIRGIEKVSLGDQQYYRIEMLILEQAG